MAKGGNDTSSRLVIIALKLAKPVAVNSRVFDCPLTF